ncbi:MAG TPA: MBL fold metallo-hydrolase, partial [bacterium]|nr:MBL fold metallo-hydrolase [bacterium]
MDGPLAETQVRENIFVWTLGGETLHTSYGTNCTAVIGPDAVLVVDPLVAPAHARLVAAAIREKTAAPVRFVVLTHHHTDHSVGASVFTQDGAVLIAHRACRERMATEHPQLLVQRREAADSRELFADAVSMLPTVTLDESLTVHLGEQEIEL